MPEQTPNLNDIGIPTRLAFIHHLLEDDLKLKPLEIRSIAYEKDFPFPYNNFIYIVDVEGPIASSCGSQPGTDKIPPGTSSFILRLSNPEAGYNDKVRIENEVAALSLARDALKADMPGLVPRVYAWGSAKEGQGWMLQEHMRGKSVLDEFPAMDAQEQSKILNQMARILAALQTYELPSSIEDFGGLGFDASGSIISEPMSIMQRGPFATYADLVRSTILSKLEEADNDAQAQGWRANGIRARLDQFLGQGVDAIFKAQHEFFEQKVLVHGDFSVDNVLYDAQTQELIGVIDFDFAHIGTAADEFFRSLGHGIGRFPDAREATDNELALQKAMLHGFPDKLPSSDEIQWGPARLWNDALERFDAYRPSTIPEILHLSELFWLSSQILPFKLCNSVIAGNSTPEQLAKRKAEGEERLDRFLEDQGF